jgi:hypothetical protein
LKLLQSKLGIFSAYRILGLVSHGSFSFFAQSTTLCHTRTHTAQEEFGIDPFEGFRQDITCGNKGYLNTVDGGF